MLKLSVVIPSYKDPLLTKTIGSLLETSELGDQMEIIAVLDGYWPSFDLVQNPRVRYIHLGQNVGMRRAINAGVRIARGEFLMRADEHQMFDQGFDRKMVEVCQPNWILTARRYALDVVKWEIMKDIPPIDFAKLKIVKMGMAKDFEDHPGENPYIEKFSGVEAKGDDSQPIQETMAMQGSCWVMPHKWWDDVIGELQNEGYGPLYQDSHEMVFKTWKAGGKLMVNKNTWHAHKHRSFSRTHNNGTPENPSKNEECWAYSLSVWREYFEKEILPKWK